MRIICQGRMYLAAELRTFRTADPSTPSIYLTRNGRAVFVVTRDSDGTMAVHRAATAEIISLSRRHGIVGLLGAFPATFAPARIVLESPQDPLVRQPLFSPVDSHSNGTPRAGVLT